MLVVCLSGHGQNNTDPIASLSAPTGITRNLLQDKKGNLWMATFGGVYRYDGKQFTNVTHEVTSARFFSALEDRKGILWFGTIGEGVYRYDGKSFEHITTQDGLINDEVTDIYEDKGGNIWFGASGGASRYDGKTFRNFVINGEEMSEDVTGKTFAQRQPYEMNSIIEDKKGRFWLVTRGNVFVSDGKTFANFTRAQDGNLRNIRKVIQDRNGNIWLGEQFGFWRYDGTLLTKVTTDFVGFIYEDKKGNLWTSSAPHDTDQHWLLSRYDARTLNGLQPMANVLKPEAGMLFGITEDNHAHIWFGAIGGVYRYDGVTVQDFKGR